MKWSDRYALGVDVIDQQHQVLFGLIDQLAQGICSGESEAVLSEVFCALQTYVQVHFLTEQSLMENSFFPGAVAHAAQHHEFERSLSDLVQRSHSGSPWTSIETMNFLRQWLFHHIDDTDRALATHLVASDRCSESLTDCV